MQLIEQSNLHAAEIAKSESCKGHRHVGDDSGDEGEQIGVTDDTRTNQEHQKEKWRGNQSSNDYPAEPLYLPQTCGSLLISTDLNALAEDSQIASGPSYYLGKLRQKQRLVGVVE
jgi:hypothetical protein